MNSADQPKGEAKAVLPSGRLTRQVARGWPSFRRSEIWRSPLHHLPMRDEILYLML